MNHGNRAWLADFNHPHYQAAKKAIVKVFNTEPDFTREGCSIPVTLIFQELIGNCLLLPIGASDDGAHSQNEKINIKNYIDGVRARLDIYHNYQLRNRFLFYRRQSYLVHTFKKRANYERRVAHSESSI